MPNLVLYHAACWDGFCAAWLAHKAAPDAEYMAVQYGEEPPDVTGKHVWILDFSYKRPVLLDMKAKAASLIVIDHHKTAQEDLAGLDFCTFDMSKSGARLTWEYLQRNAAIFEFFRRTESPWLVDYTEDRDLWLHKLTATKQVNAALRTLSFNFEVWDTLHENGESALNALAVEGIGILRYQQKLIDSHVAHAREMEVMGHRVLCVNCTCADLTSEVAGTLAIGRPFGMCWFEGDDNERVFSLRSAPDGIDVSEIAKMHGGGGHKHAAGFRTMATGATGTYSKGQLSPDDLGDLSIAIASDKEKNVVLVDFGTRVDWMGLDKVTALQLAEKLQYCARKLK